MGIEDFKACINDKGQELYRPMPWREDTRPYYVLVSELMLQQTQVARVFPKFEAFIEAFPDEKTLAETSLANVLKLWQGLGYNRRAKFLHEAASMIIHDFGGQFPDNEKDLLKLPGVGKNTAGAILAYAFNSPALFVETNVRTVIIHHFFADTVDVTDADISDVLEKSMDYEHPREFYWAMMDYGSWLKANGVKNISQSRHYKKQGALKGSLREMRGIIINILTQDGEVERLIDDDRYAAAIESLLRDGMIRRREERIELTK